MIHLHVCVLRVMPSENAVKVMSCLPTFLQNGRDCFLVACGKGHRDIVRELLTKDKVDQNVVNKVRN